MLPSAQAAGWQAGICQAHLLHAIAGLLSAQLGEHAAGVVQALV